MNVDYAEFQKKFDSRTILTRELPLQLRSVTKIPRMNNLCAQFVLLAHKMHIPNACMHNILPIAVVFFL